MSHHVSCPWGNVTPCFWIVQPTSSTRTSAERQLFWRGELFVISTSLDHQVTQMATVQSTSRQIFQSNISPWLKTFANPRKPIQGQAPRVFLSCASGTSDRGYWGPVGLQPVRELSNLDHRYIAPWSTQSRHDTHHPLRRNLSSWNEVTRPADQIHPFPGDYLRCSKLRIENTTSSLINFSQCCLAWGKCLGLTAVPRMHRGKGCWAHLHFASYCHTEHGSRQEVAADGRKHNW